MSLLKYIGRRIPNLSQGILALSVSPCSLQQDRTNAHRATLGRVSRNEYLRRYPIKLIRPDGSSIEIRAAEPRQVVELAIDLKALSEDARRQRLAARKPKVKKIKQEIIDDNFDALEYMKMWGADAETSMPTEKKNKKNVVN